MVQDLLVMERKEVFKRNVRSSNSVKDRKIPKSLVFHGFAPVGCRISSTLFKFRVKLRYSVIAELLQESSWSNAIEIFASNAHSTYSLVMYNAVLAVAEWSQALQMLEDMSQGAGLRG